MRSRTQDLQKALLAARTVMATGFGTWQLARSACRNAANQKWSELSKLIQLLRTLRPKWVMEVGVCSGGTLALWSHVAQPTAHLIGMDVEIGSEAEQRIRAAMKPTQSLQLVRCDSHDPRASEQIASTLNGNELDFLFIDGDHSYEGVKQDWQTYSAFVRSGGLIAFHDIVPDYASRFGIRTNCDAGAVNEFWREIKQEFPHFEFVEDPTQDGYGIGVIRA